MSNQNGIINSICLCNSFPSEPLAYKDFLLSSLKSKSANKIVFGGCSEFCHYSEHGDLLHNDLNQGNILTLQVLFDVGYYNKKSCSHICGKICQILAYLCEDKKFIEEIYKALHCSDSFVQYTIAKLLSCVLLTGIEEHEEYLKRLIGDLFCSTNKIGALTVFQQIVEYLPKSVHQFAGTEIVALSINVDTPISECKNLIAPPVLNCAAVQVLTVKLLHQNMPQLIYQTILNRQELAEAHLDLKQNVLDVNSQDSVNSAPAQVLMDDTLLLSSMRLWHSLIEFHGKEIHEHNVENLLKHTWQWPKILDMAQHLSRNEVLLFLINLNSMLPCQEVGKNLQTLVNVDLHIFCCSFLESLQNQFFNNAFQGAAPWGFGGPICDSSLKTITRFCGNPILQKLILLILKTLHFLRLEDTGETFLRFLRKGLDFISYKMKEESIDWLIYLFNDQDDLLVEALLHALDIYLNIPEDMQQEYSDLIDPNCLFASFVLSIQYDYQVLLDFLTSSDTLFLSYFVRYLKFFKLTIEEKEANTASVSGRNMCERKGETFVPLVDYSDSDDEDDGQICNVSNNITKIYKGDFAGNSEVLLDKPIFRNFQKSILLNMGEFEGVNSTNKSVSALKLKSKKNPSLKTKHNIELENPGVLENILDMFSELRTCVLKLEGKNLFPYNAKPLLKLLDLCLECNKEKQLL